MIPLFGKVDGYFIIGNLRDASNAPGAVENEVSGIERNMLFEFGNSFENIAPALIEVRCADIFFEKTVLCIFAAEAFNNFLACPGVLVVTGKNGLENIYCSIQSEVSL